MFGRKKRPQTVKAAVQTVPKIRQNGRLYDFSNTVYQSKLERSLYDSMRESVPIIDAAIEKIIRLIGGFTVETTESVCQKTADDFVRNVRANGTELGLDAFVFGYLNNLLTYGEAVGEMIPDRRKSGVAAVYNASLDDVEIRSGSSPLEPVVCVNEVDGVKPVVNQKFVICSLLNQKPGTVRGKSLISGLPFVSEILLKIFGSVKNNWERAGDVRFAVTYTPSDNEVFSEESARQIADEWKKAIRSDSVCDFVSVGNVSIKAIGAESQIPDCEVPLRAVLEQILSKLGIPPFLLGISWSSTERMSEQQADILTSELEYYRRAVEPAIRKIVEMHLRLRGFDSGVRVVWDDINLQDTVELSQARLNNARALQIEKEVGWEEKDET
ncbi:MAG TPA: serine/threonine protein phosphatase [Ruminococcaceae bacterium]|nr:serine/threonine protein phosphatase [Oscillospiraceae bacterium]